MLVVRLFVLELCDATMDKLFSESNNRLPPLPPHSEVLLQLAEAVKHIHLNNLIHRDIKPQNILLSVDQAKQKITFKLSDFGLCKEVNVRGTYTPTDPRGTLSWMAPELLKKLDEVSFGNSLKIQDWRGTVKSDNFSLGVVFAYYLGDGIHPYGSSNQEISVNLRDKKYSANLTSKLLHTAELNLIYYFKLYFFYADINADDLRELVRKMVIYESKERPTSSEIVQELTKINGVNNNERQQVLLVYPLIPFYL